MNGQLDGIAHLSFLGGGIFLPARTRYDRQLLREYIGDRVGTKGRVQLLVDGRRWIVSANDFGSSARCTVCMEAIGAVRCCMAGDPALHCLRCTLGDRADRPATPAAEAMCAARSEDRQPTLRSAR